MSWRRGLIRLWIVASLAWGIIVGAFLLPLTDVEAYFAYWQYRITQPELLQRAELKRSEIEDISSARTILEHPDCHKYISESQRSSEMPQKLTNDDVGRLLCQYAQKKSKAKHWKKNNLKPLFRSLIV
jgi:hypothetical protein